MNSNRKPGSLLAIIENVLTEDAGQTKFIVTSEIKDIVSAMKKINVSVRKLKERLKTSDSSEKQSIKSELVKFDKPFGDLQKQFWGEVAKQTDGFSGTLTERKAQSYLSSHI